MMTKLQKLEIERLRRSGASYNKISTTLNLSKNTIKSYCQRNNLGGAISNDSKQNDSCRNCGQLLGNGQGIKQKRFCSNKCRMSWWKQHPENINRKAVYSFNCVNCGAEFTAYGNGSRKYCSHGCYVAVRFGKETTQ